MYYYYFHKPKWKTVEYSRSQIIRSGKIIKNDNSTKDQLDQATKVIDNWRSAHAYPLHIIYTHLRKMTERNTDIIVADRLKRLESIISKLKREPTMSLWTIQDLGGCRVIVPELNDVYEYADKYYKSRKRHIFIKDYDYIKQPKKTGYRSFHVVYQYHSDKVDTYNNNMLIEIQFRTRLQHLWATSVETMGLFTKQAIKSGQGTKEVTRFFKLISSLFAIQEGTPVVPDTTENVDGLVKEIKFLNDKHNFLGMLSAFRVAVDVKASDNNKRGYYILILNYDTRLLHIDYYKPSEIETANQQYNQIEKKRYNQNIDAVLVQVSSFQTLKSAYPNYFSDIGEFIKIVNSYLDA